MSQWRTVTDKKGREYYYNKATKQTTWTKPPELQDAAAPPPPPPASSPAKPKPNGGWKEAIDAKGRVYFYNKSTKQTQWTRPPEMGGGDSPAPSPPGPKSAPAPRAAPPSPAAGGGGSAGTSSAEVEQLKRAMKHLRTQFENEQKTARLTELSMNNMREELTDAETQLNELKTEKKRLADEVTDLTKRASTAESKFAKARDELVIDRSKLQKLETQLASAKASSGGSSQALAALQAQVAKLTEENKRLTADLAQARQTARTNEELFKKAQNQVAECQAQADRAVAAAKSANERVKRLSSTTTAPSLLPPPPPQSTRVDRTVSDIGALASSVPQRKAVKMAGIPEPTRSASAGGGASPWVEHTDPGTGKKYYHNTSSGQTSWTAPPGLGGGAGGADKPVAKASPWQELSDPHTKKPYYFNPITNKTQWERPIEMDLPPPDTRGGSKSIIPPPPPAGGADDTIGPMRSFAKSNTRMIRSDSHIDVRPLGSLHAFEIRPVSDPMERKLDMHHQNTFTMSRYAEKYFNQGKKGMLGKKSTVADLICWQKKPIAKPLHTINDSKMADDCVQTFRNVTSFMGDRSSSKAPVGHIEKLCRMAQTSAPELRDEIFAQVVKQITNNPDTSSTLKGWKLLAILLGGFPPSMRFAAYLKTFIQANKEQTRNTQYAAWAAWVEDLLYDALSKDARQTPPSEWEMQFVEERKGIETKIYFCDGSYKKLDLFPQSTPAEVVRCIVSQTGVPAEAAPGHLLWGLFHIGMDGRSHRLNDNDRITDVRNRWFHRLEESKIDTSNVEMKLMFKAELFLSNCYSNPTGNMLEFLFMQGNADVVHGNYSLDNKQMFHLAGLQIQAQYEDEPVNMTQLLAEQHWPRFFPSAVRNKYKIDHSALQRAVTTEREGMKGMSSVAAKEEYVRIVQQCAMYGCEFFECHRIMNRNEDDVVLGVGEKGLSTLHPITRQEMKKAMPWETFSKVNALGKEITFETTKGVVHKFTCPKVNALFNAVQSYRTVLAIGRGHSASTVVGALRV